MEFGCYEIHRYKKEKNKMKNFLVCDCCDEVFDALESTSEVSCEELEILTGYKINSIIKNSKYSDGSYFSSTCDHCNTDLNNNEFNEFLFIVPTFH